MSEQDGALWLAGRRTDLQNNPEYIERSRLARNAVASRKAGLDQGEVIHKPSEALALTLPASPKIQWGSTSSTRDGVLSSQT